MAKISLSSLKTFFQTGDRPSQTDYENLIDSTAAQATDLGSAGNNESTISGIESATVIDNFDATIWRMVKYIISIKKTSAGANKFYATEMTILVDGTNVSVSEYGTIDNDGNIGTIDVSRVGNTVALTVTPATGVTPITVRYARMGLKA
jgi:archaellum component FlaG (FlaF/FlaG flagellin family)